MQYSAPLRKLSLTLHIIVSVGWLGSVMSFLALAAVGLLGTDETVRAVYGAASILVWWVIVPLCMLSLASGVIHSLGTPWGLLQYYWVVAKLAITVVATALLFLHTQPVDRLAQLALESSLAAGDLRSARMQVAGDAAAIVALLIATALSIYKPGGMTAYGQRKARGVDASSPRWVYAVAVLGGALFVVIVIVHLTGRGLGGH